MPSAPLCQFPKVPCLKKFSLGSILNLTNWPRMISSQTGPAGIAKASRFDADAWFTPGRFAALLAALIVVTFFRVVSGQESFFYRDFGSFGYPLAYYHRDALCPAEFQLWTTLY